MMRFEADQYVSIADADGAGIIVCHVDAADGEPDVAHNAVQFAWRNNAPYRRCDPVGQGRRHLEPRPRRGANVELDLAAIYGREKILTE
jgi:hypothetical protein